uniref:Ankyrin repeat and SOCS box protein 1 n=1 Tax=Equus caballus TaxID=9796 RepID=A0A9L0SF83_HORSE
LASPDSPRPATACASRHLAPRADARGSSRREARPEVEARTPCARHRKPVRKAHARRKSLSDAAHLPAAPEVVAAALLPVGGARWGRGRREAGWGRAEGRSSHGGGRRPRRAGRAGARSRINEKSVWCCGWLPCTPLRIAATAGHGNCVDFLIQKGAEVDLVDVKGQTALYVAVVNGHLESAQILLEAGADPNGSRHHRSTPVYHASRVGRADILKALIRYGADVDVNHHLTPDIRPPFSRRLTSLVVCPLYISAAYHNLQCFKLLLQAGANPDFNCNGPVNTQGFYRGSPGCVMDAVLRHGCEAAFVSLLVEFGANLNLVKWESLGPESRGRRKVDPEALQVFKEARSVPRTLLNLCRVAVRRALGKYRLHLIPSLPLPDPIKKFLLYE